VGEEKNWVNLILTVEREVASLNINAGPSFPEFNQKLFVQKFQRIYFLFAHERRMFFPSADDIRGPNDTAIFIQQ
jgi:hypothetical protein